MIHTVVSSPDTRCWVKTTHHGGKLNRCWWIHVDLFISHLLLFSRTLLRKRSCAWPWTAWAPSSTSWTTSTGSARSCSVLKRWGVDAALTSSPQRRWRVRPLRHRHNVPQSSCLCGLQDSVRSSSKSSSSIKLKIIPKTRKEKEKLHKQKSNSSLSGRTRAQLHSQLSFSGMSLIFRNL